VSTDESKAEKERNRLAWETAFKRLDSEIDLLWRRGLYFWTFIAAAFLAYFAIPSDQIFDRKLVAAFGFLISVGWCLANMGSKYWQAVWEVKVKQLEKSVTGELYGKKLSAEEMGSKIELLRGRRFSVSRIAIAISAIVAMLWLLILISLSYPGFAGRIENLPYVLPMATIISSILLVFLTYSDE
jgi:hypothetical protein